MQPQTPGDNRCVNFRKKTHKITPAVKVLLLANEENVNVYISKTFFVHIQKNI
jgi:hypothetical protein